MSSMFGRREQGSVGLGGTHNLALDIIFNDDEDDFLDNVIVYLQEQYMAQPNIPRPCRTRPFSRHALVHDVLGGHEDRGYMFRMSNHVFYLLRDALIENETLKPTRFLSCNEQLAIFLHGIGHAIPNRVLAELFQHSGETISRYFNFVLREILSLRHQYIQLPPVDTPVHPRIHTNPNFYPAFKNALGAIDGTHIPAQVRKSKQDRYRNRKGFTSQNVMAMCSFDHTFLYVAVGWEGSAADMKVLRWALEQGGFSVPDGSMTGKWYVVFRGRVPGVYATWSECHMQVSGFRGNSYQSYRMLVEAEWAYMQFHRCVSTPSTPVFRTMYCLVALILFVLCVLYFCFGCVKAGLVF